MSKIQLRSFETVEAVNKGLADFILKEAVKAVQLTGRFLWCLSGGNTPKSLYELMATEPYKTQMPWQQTFVFWGDERCVAIDSLENNANMAKKALLNKVDLPAANIYPIQSELSPADAARAYEIKLHDFFEGNKPEFDLILLGIGEDGHTASLVPGSTALTEHRKWVVDVFYPNQNQFRISLTLPVLNAAKAVVFLCTGSNKREILKSLFHDVNPIYPAAMVKPKSGNLYLYTNEKALV